MPSLQLQGAASCLHGEVWVAGCLFSRRHEVSTMSQLCALSILFNTPLLVSGNHFLLCILASLHSRNLCTLWVVGKLACPRLLSLLHHSHWREGLSSCGGQPEKGSLFQAGCIRMETFSIASAFRWEEQLGPSPGQCLSFSRIQELEAICPPLCVHATSSVLPTYKSKLGQGCAVSKVIWLQVQFKCYNTAINQATSIFISIWL